jgi:hypothetical protein
MYAPDAAAYAIVVDGDENNVCAGPFLFSSGNTAMQTSAVAQLKAVCRANMVNVKRK